MLAVFSHSVQSWGYASYWLSKGLGIILWCYKYDNVTKRSHSDGLWWSYQWKWLHNCLNRECKQISFYCNCQLKFLLLEWLLYSIVIITWARSKDDNWQPIQLLARMMFEGEDFEPSMMKVECILIFCEGKKIESILQKFL